MALKAGGSSPHSMLLYVSIFTFSIADRGQCRVHVVDDMNVSAAFHRTVALELGRAGGIRLFN